MPRSKTLGSVAVFLSLWVANGANAGPLGVDPDGMPGFTGAVSFFADGPAGDLFADVDYAVFAPGEFTGDDPSGGTDYVYAYQVFNTGDVSDAVVAAFSVGLVDGNLAHSAGDDPNYALPGGVGPDGAYVLIDSVGFTFVTSQVDPGLFSTVLLFADPHEPMFGVGSVIDGGLSDHQPVPTPTPEPTTLALLGLVGLAALRRRR